MPGVLITLHTDGHGAYLGERRYENLRDNCRATLSGMPLRNEAARARRVFEGFVATGSATRLVPMLHSDGVPTKTGRPFDKGATHKLLNCRILVGDISHKGQHFVGEHEAIVPRALWDEVHGILRASPGCVPTRTGHGRRRCWAG